MRLSGSHLGHEVVGVDREALLLRLSGVQQVGVQCVAELRRDVRLRLIQVVTGEESVEVGVGRVGDVEMVRGQAVAVRPKVRCVVLREGGVGLEEALVVEHLLLLRKGLGLDAGQILRRVELGGADVEAGGGVVDGQRLIEAETRDVIVEGRMR